MIKKTIDRNQLKYIAALAMLIDHIGMFFVDDTTLLGFIMRLIGRLTAPIMCYFIAEGYYFTSSKLRYGARLFLFAVLSQFAYAFSHGMPFLTLDFNVLYTFFICFLLIASYEKISVPILKGAAITVLFVLSSFGDWGVIAPFWVLVFWIYREDFKMKILGFVFGVLIMTLAGIWMMLESDSSWYNQIWQLGSLMFIPLIMRYNNAKQYTGKFSKWFFYIFYPAHLIILALIDLNLK